MYRVMVCSPWLQEKRPRAIFARGTRGRTQGKFSGCFAPLLDRLQLLAVLLRIARDLALRQAVNPQVVRNAAPFPASADGSPVQNVGRTLVRGLLLPAAA